MDENENTMLPVESAPQDETGSAATAAAEPTDEVAEAPGTIPGDEASEDVQPITIPVMFNHGSRELTLDEARTLAQKGLKFDELTPTWEKIRFLASTNGKTVPELVDALVESQDRQLYQSLLDECDGNESIAKRLHEAEKAQRQAQYETSLQAESNAEKQDQQVLAERLAADFLEMQKEFPEMTEFKEIPTAVVDTAVRKGISLMDAYLRYQHQENRKIAATRKTQKEAEKASAGSQAAGTEEASNPTMDAMMAGVWRR